MPVRSITYSERYSDDTYEYRHVILPPDLVSLVPRTHLMSETEWRNIGIQQSTGWQHFMLHQPEPYVLLFRRPKPPEVSSAQPECNEPAETEVEPDSSGSTKECSEKSDMDTNAEGTSTNGDCRSSGSEVNDKIRSNRDK